VITDRDILMRSVSAAFSSSDIQSLPHCQVMNSRKRQPQRKIFVAAVLIGGLKQKNPRLYQGNKNFSIA